MGVWKSNGGHQMLCVVLCYKSGTRTVFPDWDDNPWVQLHFQFFQQLLMNRKKDGTGCPKMVGSQNLLPGHSRAVLTHVWNEWGAWCKRRWACGLIQHGLSFVLWILMDFQAGWHCCCLRFVHQGWGVLLPPSVPHAAHRTHAAQHQSSGRRFENKGSISASSHLLSGLGFLAHLFLLQRIFHNAFGTTDVQFYDLFVTLSNGHTFSCILGIGTWFFFWWFFSLLNV